MPTGNYGMLDANAANDIDVLNVATRNWLVAARGEAASLCCRDAPSECEEPRFWWAPAAGMPARVEGTSPASNLWRSAALNLRMPSHGD